MKAVFSVILQLFQSCLLFFSEISYSNNSRKLMNWTAAFLVVLFPNSEKNHTALQANRTVPACEVNFWCHVYFNFYKLRWIFDIWEIVSIIVLQGSSDGFNTHAKMKVWEHVIPLKGFRIIIFFKGMWSTYGRATYIITIPCSLLACRWRKMILFPWPL